MTKKRVRLTKARVDRYRDMEEDIVTMLRRAQIRGEGLSDVWAEVVVQIDNADLTSFQKTLLNGYAWGIRTFLVRTEAYWQLFLEIDGVIKPVTSDEVSAMREAGDEEVWKRIRGQHVWISHLPAFKPFYHFDELPRILDEDNGPTVRQAAQGDHP